MRAGDAFCADNQNVQQGNTKMQASGVLIVQRYSASPHRQGVSSDPDPSPTPSQCSQLLLSSTFPNSGDIGITAFSIKVLNTIVSGNMPSSSNIAVESLKNVPYAEIRRDFNILRKDTGRFCDSGKPATPAFVAHVIRRWKTFVSPNTPPYGFNCPPYDPLSDYIHLLLVGMSTVLGRADRKQAVTVSSHMAPLWPDIWIWLRTFHAHAHNLGGAFNRTRGFVLVSRMLFCIDLFDPPTPLCTVVTETEGVFEMMAAMWIEEGREVSGKLGFKASGLLVLPHYRTTLPGVLSQILAKCDGSADAVCAILLCRIRNNAKQVEPDWVCLGQDFEHLLIQLPLERPDTPGSAILRQALLSHPTFANVMVDILSALLAVKNSQSKLAEALPLPLVVILRHFRIKGYDCVAQLNGTNVISIIAGLAHTYGSDEDVVQTSCDLLQTIIGRFTIYHAVFFATMENLPSVVDIITIKGRGRIGHNILALYSRVDEYMDISRTQTQHSFCCGFPQRPTANASFADVQAASSYYTVARAVRKNTGASNIRSFAQKCALPVECDAHPEPINLSGPSLRFLTKVIAHDCLNLSPEERKPFERRPSTRRAVNDLRRKNDSPEQKQRQNESLSDKDERLIDKIGRDMHDLLVKDETERQADLIERHERASRRYALLLNYDKALPERINVEVLDLEDPSAISDLLKNAPGLKTSETWRETWAPAVTALSPPATLQHIIPLLVLLPWAWDSEPQVMTAVCILHGSGPSHAYRTMGDPHIRWLHRI
ncbi:hypothetical protein FIBSPDRAFT_895700 [Athelia psychrophila]|uniref:Uncharacterized protein n=1 Tax=Athelia psychrophila TaxID=1759441 RepID=A0A166E9K3_9AGAM|nr:hypothetical protein FIBSPDRAFT_895700 [Fibularhizoctonia sp. CBS 109695]